MVEIIDQPFEKENIRYPWKLKIKPALTPAGNTEKR
jgi:hypothetical protein